MPVIPGKMDSTSEMEGLYDDEEPSEPEAAAEETEAAPATDLLDKKILMGKPVKPGDRIILDVVALRGDQIEVKYGTEEAGEPEMSEDDQLAELSK